MMNCRSSVVAEIEKPSLMDHQRLYPLLFAISSQEKSRWVVFLYCPSPRGDEFTLPSEVRVPTKSTVCCCTYILLYCFTAVCSTVHHVWVCHTRMMMLPAVACAAGHGCSVVCVISCSLLAVYTWMGVCSRAGRNANS